MADAASRIEQFKIMAEANPKDELAFFSLGRAFTEAGQHGPAAEALAKVIELNPRMSKAYQLLAASQFATGAKDAALETLKTGAHVANDRGDLMPRNDMLKTLKEHGIELPDLAAAQAPKPVTDGEVQCTRCGLVKPKMARAPFSNAQGKLIQESACADCWREWIGMGTKVINELRLPLSDPQAQKVFDQHMYEFLHLK